MSLKTYEKIVELIGAKIEAGELEPGERLPSERKLAEAYKVSRNTIREAIRILVEKGALVSRTGAGNYVAENAAQMMASVMDEALDRQRLRLREVFEFRRMLEPQVAALAAERISDGALANLEEIVQQQEKLLATGESGTWLDEMFHRFLVRSTGNAVLFSVYEKLDGILAETRSEELQSADRSLKSIEMHRELVAALKKRDAARAAEIMTLHMAQVEEITRKHEGDKE